ncbi:efflux RND transporter periplasmic adaptor subunit [Prosthecobacter sp.]|uniref:efflux RND transporter periplasmic adaptor subunit n=1 Tax=Prosthecobacter sp. TaxID=1965333 RepID=UPI003784EE5A
MKRTILIIGLVAAASGWFAGLHYGASSKHAGESGRKILFYQSPMHPWVKSEQPGQCTVCGMALVPVYEGGAGFDNAVSDIVMLPPGSPNVVGVRTAEAKVLPLTRTLRISGMIGEDESRHGIISAPVEGRIDGLSMNHEGQQVTRRQPLATIFSRTLLKAADAYKAMLPQGEQAAEPIKRTLEQYGLVWEQIKTIPQRQPGDIYFGVLSPLSGVIVKSYVHEGQQVKEGERLFEIADFTRMWFTAMVAEQDLPFLKVGQITKLNATSLPGETMTARISFISPNMDGMSRSAMVRVVLENPERRIKNNSFAQGVVEIEAPEVLAVPRSAVLWPGNEPRVYVVKEAGSYQQRRVKLGRIGDSHYEVLDGLKAGEQVVVSGGMLIDSQAQLDAMARPAEAEMQSMPQAGNHAAWMDYMKAAAVVSAALAADDLPAVTAALGNVPPAPEGLIKSAAPASGNDLKALRKVFLPWSQEIAAQALQMKSLMPELRVFRCAMTGKLWDGAPASAAWIQLGGEPRNPYWGAEMLECGMEVKP